MALVFVVCNIKLPDSVALFIFTYFIKSEPAIQVFYHIIFCGGEVVAFDGRNTLFSAPLDKPVKHGKFHIQNSTVFFADNNLYNTVVTELVNKFTVKVDIIFTCKNFFHFGRHITFCCDVELIALVGKLCNSLQVYGQEIINNSRHVKAQKIFVFAKWKQF